MEPVGHARIAACIVHRNRVISYGFNQRKTHPLQFQYAKNKDSIYLHAEIDAIKNALKRISTDNLEKATLYVVRAKKNKEKNCIWGLAKPCSGCTRTIAAFGIQKVIYTENEQTFREI